MAFRSQTGYELDRFKMSYLENHPECVDSWSMAWGDWRRSHFSVGRYLNERRRRKENFKHAVGRWAAQYGRPVPQNYVFVAWRERTRLGADVRIAVFRYRADITQALKEAIVAEVMES